MGRSVDPDGRVAWRADACGNGLGKHGRRCVMWLGICFGRDGTHGDGDQGSDEPGAGLETPEKQKSPRECGLRGVNKDPVPFRDHVWRYGQRGNTGVQVSVSHLCWDQETEIITTRFVETIACFCDLGRGR